MTNRIMFDSLYINQVPTTGAEIIAYYVDVVDAATVAKRFPNMRQNPIDRHGNHPGTGRTFDVETGLIAPDECERLITEFNDTNPTYHRGARPVIYCNRSTIASVRQGTGKYILGRDYYMWISAPGTNFLTSQELINAIMKEFPATPRFPNSDCVIACQTEFYGGYDKSVVYDSRFLP